MRQSSALIVLVVAASVFRLSAQAADEAAPYRGKVFLGLSGKAVPLPEDPRYKGKFGLQIDLVSALSSAEQAGLRVGDIIVSVDGRTWDTNRIEISQSFGKAGAKDQPGDTVDMVVLRSEPGKPDAERELETVRFALLAYPGTAPEPGGAPSNEAMRPDLKDVRPPYEALCDAVADETGLAADTRDLLARLARSEDCPDPHRLPVVRYVHRDPFKLEAVAREIAAPLAGRHKTGAADLPVLLDLGDRSLLGFGRPLASRKAPEGLPEWKGKDLNAHLEYVAAVLAAAAEWNRKALAGLTKEEIEFIREKRGGMLDSFLEYKMLSYDPDPQRVRDGFRVMTLATKVDRAALIEQARLVSLIVAPEFVESLVAAAESSKKNLEAAVVASKQTPHGTILVTGRARNRHDSQDCAAIYDLGGDDVYSNNAGSSVWPAIPSAVIVDCSGDDAYESWDPFRIGCGDMGTGIIVDRKGNDSYVGVRFTQGAGFMGIGALVDEEGDDVYRGLAFHQGIGHWGVGLLVDGAGRDRYEAHQVAQGVGLPGGMGLLFDGGGDDGYYCKGDTPSGYGERGVFEGWGQGVGMGYRPYASGGLGVLYDASGEDRFEAGNFSQGGGYFYGLGLLYGGGPEADCYIGSRYAQGFGCHQAAGVLIDEGGDDRYMTRWGVAQGLAWDESVALFLDAQGDDRYEGGPFSQCASAMNGFAIFLDLAGRDAYLYANPPDTPGNSYHGGMSLALMIDAGGADDAWAKRPNNAIVTGGQHFIFADLPGTIGEALKDDAWKGLLRKDPAPKK